MLKKLSRLVGGSISVLAMATAAAAQEPQALNQDQFVRTVDQCLAANTQTEFDTAAAVLERVRPSCTVTGTVRLPARGNPILGDLLRYDAPGGRFVWNVQLDEQNRFYGGGASPYRLSPQFDSAGRLTSPGNPPEVAAILNEVGNANFWLLPLFRTGETRDSYQASNAFGASRQVVRVRETRYGIAAHIPAGLTSLPVLEVPVDAATARAIADHLDIALTFRVGEVCRICYKSGTLERGTRPTVSAPLDEEVTIRFLYVEILRMDVIDRRTGQIYPSRLAPSR